MPELPEVLTICNQLSLELPIKIEKVQESIHLKKIVKVGYPLSLNKKTIHSIDRHGKYLIFKFESLPNVFVSHLGMSGSWQITREFNQDKHAHLILKTKNNYLTYVDPRRFGKMQFLNEKEYNDFLKRQGKDAMASDFDAQYLFHIFQKHSSKVLKPFLLDQKYFSGIGNYMASEICARAFLLPHKSCKEITLWDCERMMTGLKSLLHHTIENKGVTFQGGYHDAYGNKGDGVKNLVVFHQQRCGMCLQTSVKKIVLQGRGTYYCPHCQH